MRTWPALGRSSNKKKKKDSCNYFILKCFVFSFKNTNNFRHLEPQIKFRIPRSVHRYEAILCFQDKLGEVFATASAYSSLSASLIALFTLTFTYRWHIGLCVARGCSCSND